MLSATAARASMLTGTKSMKRRPSASLMPINLSQDPPNSTKWFQSCWQKSWKRIANCSTWTWAARTCPLRSLSICVRGYASQEVSYRCILPTILGFMSPILSKQCANCSGVRTKRPLSVKLTLTVWSTTQWTLRWWTGCNRVWKMKMLKMGSHSSPEILSKFVK